jgi:hypothetical protein
MARWRHLAWIEIHSSFRSRPRPLRRKCRASDTPIRLRPTSLGAGCLSTASNSIIDRRSLWWQPRTLSGLQIPNLARATRPASTIEVGVQLTSRGRHPPRRASSGRPSRIDSSVQRWTLSVERWTLVCTGDTPATTAVRDVSIGHDGVCPSIVRHPPDARDAANSRPSFLRRRCR